MVTRAWFTNAEGTLGVFAKHDGVQWSGPLPPTAGDICVEFDAYIAEGGTIDDYVAPPLPDPRPSIESWGMARFTVGSGALTQTQDAKNIASVLRLAAGKYRVFPALPPETLMVFPVAIDPSNDRRAFPAPRAADHFDIRCVNAAGVLCDAAEVYVEFKRII